MIEVSLRNYLKADAAISALVAEKVFGVMAPQTIVPPLLIFSKAAGFYTEATYCGPDALQRCVFQFDSYGRNFIDALSLARAVRLAMIGFQGEMGDTHISYVSLETELQMLDPEPGLFRVSTTMLIWYAEGDI